MHEHVLLPRVMLCGGTRAGDTSVQATTLLRLAVHSSNNACLQQYCALAQN
jgi:hypothetical protein